MSRDMMRGIGYGVAFAGMADALWWHDRMFIVLWTLYGISCLLAHRTSEAR